MNNNATWSPNRDGHLFCRIESWAFGLGGALAGALLVLSGLNLGVVNPDPVPASSETSGWTQPYGGCKEAWQAPDSDGARACRRHGWIVRPRMVVAPPEHVAVAPGWHPANARQARMMGQWDCIVRDGTTIATGLVAICP